MKILPLLRSFHMPDEEQQHQEGHVPTDIDHGVGCVRRFAHDEQVGRPMVTADQGAEEKDHQIEPGALSAADILQKAHQQHDDRYGKLQRVLQIIPEHTVDQPPVFSRRS